MAKPIGVHRNWEHLLMTGFRKIIIEKAEDTAVLVLKQMQAMHIPARDPN